MDIILLSVIALALIVVVAGDYQIHLFSERMLKRFRYKRSRHSTLTAIWDLEFKRDSCEAAREAERILFDKISEQVVGYQTRIEKLKERNQTGDEEDIKKSGDKLQELLDARKMHQDQMDELDTQMIQFNKNTDDLRSIVGLLDEKIKKT